MPNPALVYDLGILVGERWRQWANGVGQDVYQNVQNPDHTQISVPEGFEDSPQDTWTADTTRDWPQWRNDRTGRILLQDPHPPPPVTYLDRVIIKMHLRDLERNHQRKEGIYRQILIRALNHFFNEEDNFSIYIEKRPELTVDGEPGVRTAVLKTPRRIDGNLYSYDYCLIEGKRVGASWAEAKDHISKYCAVAQVASKRLYGVIHMGLEVQFFKANRGELTQMSERLHLLRDSAQITEMLEQSKTCSLPTLESM